MGLDISHDAWHGGYISFMAWREKIAEVAGMPPLMFMEGFYEAGGHRDPLQCLHLCCAERKPSLVSEKSRRALPIRWDALKPDPLHVLLYHSDCDGDISPEDCKGIADRLEEILPRFPEGDGGGHIGNWKEKTQQFIDGCRAAHEAGEPLEFH